MADEETAEAARRRRVADAARKIAQAEAVAPSGTAERRPASAPHQSRQPQTPSTSPGPTAGLAPQPGPASAQGPATWAPPDPATRQPARDGYAAYPPPPMPGGGTPFTPSPAGSVYSAWWKRVVAALIDGFVLSIPSSIVFAAMGPAVHTDPVTGQTEFRHAGVFALAYLVYLVASFAYYVVLEGGPRGATVGKMAMGIQIRTADGLGPIGYAKAFGRRLVAILLWFALFLPGLIDVLMPLWDSRHQAIHDKVVGTVVVDVR